jgi:hypothetical protein
MRHPISAEQATQEGWFRPNRNGGLCECGCGLPAPLAPQSFRERGWVSGEPLRFRNGHSGYLLRDLIRQAGRVG